MPRCKLPARHLVAISGLALFLFINAHPGHASVDPAPTPTARAAQPSAAVDFAIGIDVNGDGKNDCGTGVPLAVGDGAPDDVRPQVFNTACSAALGATLEANVYLMNNGGISYAGAAAFVYYDYGITSQGPGAAVWEGHHFDAFARSSRFESSGSVIDVPPAAPQANLGLMNTFKFTLTCNYDDGLSFYRRAKLRLGQDAGETGLVDETLVEYRDTGTDSLTIYCETRTGDANCDDGVNAVDAQLILQFTAGIYSDLPCRLQANVNHDCTQIISCVGIVDAIDAAIVLQGTAGLYHFCSVPHGWGSASVTWCDGTDGKSLIGHSSAGTFASELMYYVVYTDTYFSAEVSTPNYSASLIFRAWGDNRYLAVFQPDGLPVTNGEAGAIRLYKVADGTQTLLGSAHPTPFPSGSDSVRLGVVAVGSDIKVFMNDTLALETGDSTFALGQVGLRVYGDNDHSADATFASISISDVP